MNRRKLLTVINDTLYFFLYNHSIAHARKDLDKEILEHEVQEQAHKSNHPVFHTFCTS